MVGQRRAFNNGTENLFAAHFTLASCEILVIVSLRFPVPFKMAFPNRRKRAPGRALDAPISGTLYYYCRAACQQRGSTTQPRSSILGAISSVTKERRTGTLSLSRLNWQVDGIIAGLLFQFCRFHWRCPEKESDDLRARVNLLVWLASSNPA